jgi:hypothetical protein
MKFLKLTFEDQDGVFYVTLLPGRILKKIFQLEIEQLKGQIGIPWIENFHSFNQINFQFFLYKTTFHQISYPTRKSKY